MAVCVCVIISSIRFGLLLLLLLGDNTSWQHAAFPIDVQRPQLIVPPLSSGIGLQVHFQVHFANWMCVKFEREPKQRQHQQQGVTLVRKCGID